ncbi:restriction endonuclease subunit S [Leucobacter sp. gxy201]|uniref:restriction endonuclease subunit S n=1 Tax=Leucobacter sp. gxy201 TaxID=2957200 RepID=UPI003DA1B194
MTAQHVKDWSEKRLGDLATMKSGGTPSSKVPKYYGGGIPWVSIADMTANGKYVKITAKTLSAVGLSASAASVYEPDVVLYAMYASLGECAIAVGAVSSSQAILGINVGAELDRNYLYYFLSSIKREVKITGQQGTQANLNAGMVRDFRIPLPPLEEQKRLAGVLADTDDLISTLERLIAKKQAIKTGMMQQLLTGKTRLPGHDRIWTDTAVGSIGRVVGGGTPSTRVSSYWGGDIPWFAPAEIKSEGSGVVTKSERTITAAGLSGSAAAILPAGSVLVTSRASIGNCAVAGKPVSTNQGFTSLIPNDLRSTWFFYYWVQLNRSKFESRAAGSTFLEISASKVRDLPIHLPPLEEQEAIGNAIKDVDAQLSALQDRLRKVRNIKQGMMQQLLTGRTRLPAEATS